MPLFFNSVARTCIGDMPHALILYHMSQFIVILCHIRSEVTVRLPGCCSSCYTTCLYPRSVPTGSPSRTTELAHSFLFCFCVCFCLYGPFNCILFHKFSQQLSAFSLCSSGLICTLLVLSTMCLFMKVSLSPDIILCG